MRNLLFIILLITTFIFVNLSYSSTDSNGNNVKFHFKDLSDQIYRGTKHLIHKNKLIFISKIGELIIFNFENYNISKFWLFNPSEENISVYSPVAGKNNTIYVLIIEFPSYRSTKPTYALLHSVDLDNNTEGSSSINGLGNIVNERITLRQYGSYNRNFTPIILNKNFIIFERNGFTWSIDLNDYSINWQKKLYGWIADQPILSKNKIIILTSRGVSIIGVAEDNFEDIDQQGKPSPIIPYFPKPPQP